MDQIYHELERLRDGTATEDLKLSFPGWESEDFDRLLRLLDSN